MLESIANQQIRRLKINSIDVRTMSCRSRKTADSRLRELITIDILLLLLLLLLLLITPTNINLAVDL